jgi:hypothetical protein
MEMKITQSLVREVKKHLKKKLHDQAWHDYNRLPSTEAVTYALRTTEEYDRQPRDIVEQAKKYLINFNN